MNVLGVQSRPTFHRNSVRFLLSARFRRRARRPWCRGTQAPGRLADSEAATTPSPTSDAASLDATNPPAIVIQHNVAAQRFESHLTEGVAELAYRYSEHNVLALLDVTAPSGPLGAHAARRLMRAALEFARSERLSVIPMSPFADAYLSRHPEFRDLLRSRDAIERRLW